MPNPYSREAIRGMSETEVEGYLEAFGLKSDDWLGHTLEFKREGLVKVMFFDESKEA